MSQVKRVHHIALVVEDLEKTLTFWRDVMGIELSQIQDMPQEEAQIAFLPLQNSEIELVLPKNDDSGLGKYLAKRGPGIHHICFEVDDLDAIIARLKEKQIRLINEQPRTNQSGRRYIFIHPESTFGVLVELYEQI
ncbi:MAG: methylmalonyl-CoA epimerase [Anaerolineales bacterium]